MKTRLFNDDSETWTSDGIDFSNEIHNAIKEVVTKYKNANFSLRDMELIAMNTVSLHIMEETMSEQLRISNIEKQKRLEEFKLKFDTPDLRNKIIAQALKDGLRNCESGFVPLIKACRFLLNCSSVDAKDYVERNFPELVEDKFFPFSIQA